MKSRFFSGSNRCYRLRIACIVWLLAILSLGSAGFAVEGQDTDEGGTVAQGKMRAFEIRKAIADDQSSKVTELLNEDPSLVLSADAQGNTPLHAFARGQYPDMNLAKLLLAHGADIDAKNQRGATPLHIAAHDRNQNMMQLLLEMGADINARDSDGYTPLLDAAVVCHQEIVQYLVDNKAETTLKTNSGDTALHLAVMCADLGRGQASRDEVVLLLAGKADINARGNHGATALHVAAISDQKDLMDLLIANHAQVNAKDKDGFTPLHYAAMWSCKRAAESLLANHADVNAKDNRGHTPLHLAITSGHGEIRELLRPYGGEE